MLNRSMQWLLYLSILTTSFDIFLVVDLGVNVRISQILLLLPFIYIIHRVNIKRKIIFPLGFGYLILWTFFIILFIPNTSYLVRSIGYALWLIFDVYLIFFMVNFIDTYPKLINLLKIYIFSFLFISLFGLYQFISPFFGLPEPLIMQWWIPGILPRINGFSYEPSYFATYLLIGWSLNYFLLRYKIKIMNPTILKAMFLLETCVMILSSSRMGYLMMAMVLLEYPIRLGIELGKEFINHKIKMITLKKIGKILGSMIIGIILISTSIKEEEIEFLGAGLALFGNTSSHSSDTRISEASDTFAVFLENPLIGYSLGGVAASVAGYRGFGVNDLEDLKSNEGMAVFLEALAASGIIGIIPFILYFYILIRKIWTAIRHKYDTFNILLPLVAALIMELIILQFNQNILRPYLWMHIAILSAGYNVVMVRQDGESPQNTLL